MAKPLFRNATNSFLDSLSNEERVHFDKIQRPEDIINHIKTINAPGFTGDRSRRTLARITKFIERAKPYFSIVDIAIQSDPTVASLVWSGIRLVTQLAVNFCSFFDKLTDMIEKIGKRLPIYEQYIGIFENKMPPTLEFSLCEVYKDLLLFFYECIKLFSKRRSRLLKPLRPFMDLMWVPFENRFSDLLDRIQEHHEIIKEEVHAANLVLEDAERERQRVEREKQRLARRKIDEVYSLTESEKAARIRKAKSKVLKRCLKWISPKEFMGTYEKALDSRLEGTAEWIFQNQKYQLWENYKSSNILWINGSPGRGKTILAGSIVEKMQQTIEISGSKNNALAYFFFQKNRKDQTSRDDAYRAMIAQILDQHSQDENVVDKISFVMEEKRTGQLAASQRQLLEILQLLKEGFHTTTFVLDGIDECSDGGDFVVEMIRLADSPSVRLLFLSRPNVRELYEDSDRYLTLAFEADSVIKDIGAYLEIHISDMQAKGMLPATLDYQDIYQRLLSGADGMFLWAHLMVTFLQSKALTPWQRHQTIMSVNFPEGLETMYDRILSLLRAGNSAERHIAKRVVSWLLNWKDNLTMTTAEMRVALKLAVQGVQGPGDEISDDAVIVSCAGLVEKFRNIHENIIIFRLIHLSLAEYLEKLAGEPGEHQWLFDIDDIDQELALVCLSYLTYCVPAGPLSGEVGRRPDRPGVQNCFPFIKYAAMNWTRYLWQFCGTDTRTLSTVTMKQVSTSVSSLFSALEKFITQKAIVMAWIESYYLFHDYPIFHEVLRYLEVASSEFFNNTGFVADNDAVVIFEKLRQLAKDLRDLDTNWRTVLINDPYTIWVDVTAFAKSDFWLQTNATKVEEFDAYARAGTKESIETNNVHRDDHEHSETPFAATDSVSQDGSTLGILTVHYPLAFRKLLDRPAPITFGELYKYSSGWKARFETWDLLQAPSRKASQIWLDLEQEEVWIQLCQTLRREETSQEREWKVQFPLAVSASLDIIAVLRTVYRLKTINSSPTSNHVSSVKLPVENLPRTLQTWCTYESSKGYEAMTINSEEHFSEYTVVFSHCPSTIAYTEFERTTKKRTLAIFEILWQENDVGARLIRSKTFLGGPGVEGNSNWRFRIDKLETVLRENPANWSGMASRGNLPVGKSLIAFHPWKSLIAYSTFFGVSVWDYTTDASEDIYSEMSEHQSSHLKFSECGAFITLLDHRQLNSFSPIIIIPLKGRATIEKSKLKMITSSSATSKSNFDIQTMTRKRKLVNRINDGADIDRMDIQHRNCSKKMMMDPAGIQFSNTKNRTTAEWLSYDNNNNTIDLRQIDKKGECMRRSLCSIPKTDKYKDRIVTMAGRSVGGEGGSNHVDYVNLVLQKLPQSSHTLSGQPYNLPIVVRRAQGTFQTERPSVNKITGSTKSREGSVWNYLQTTTNTIEAGSAKLLTADGFKYPEEVAAIPNQWDITTYQRRNGVDIRDRNFPSNYQCR
ncbi:hypothetical protein TWF694_004557 [Orbilia ellipsospora]|uniref:NACHT domain-containing protein n=1 Tax=Orbilia ellipsospora TaxID=2528407 RepID=A0AAV9WWT2_9PEZI